MKIFFTINFQLWNINIKSYFDVISRCWFPFGQVGNIDSIIYLDTKKYK